MDDSDQSIRRARLRICDPAHLIWVHWDVDSVLYNGYTGETHLLSPIPMEVLSVLRGGELPFGDLCAELAARCEQDDSDPWKQKVAGVIRELALLDIIEYAFDDA